jgi:D-alanine-D-alanine ligase
MANYLFEDFEQVIRDLSSVIPDASRVKISYEYIDSISSAKGK